MIKDILIVNSKRLINELCIPTAKLVICYSSKLKL